MIVSTRSAGDVVGRQTEDDDALGLDEDGLPEIEEGPRTGQQDAAAGHALDGRFLPLDRLARLRDGPRQVIAAQHLTLRTATPENRCKKHRHLTVFFWVQFLLSPNFRLHIIFLVIVYVFTTLFQNIHYLN